MGNPIGSYCGLSAWAAADFLARHVSRRIGPNRAFISMYRLGLAIARRSPLGRSQAGTVDDSRERSIGTSPHRMGMGLRSRSAEHRCVRFALPRLCHREAGTRDAHRGQLSGADGGAGARVRRAAENCGGAGTAAVLAGVMLTVIPAATAPVNSGVSPDKAERGLGWALTAALGFGVMFWLLGFHVTPVLGGALPVWLMRLMGALVVVVLPLRRRRVPVIPRGNIGWLLAASALLDTTAFVANNMGLALGHVSVVTVLASLFGPLAVLLAWIFLGERLSRRQWFGVTLIFLGVALVSI